MKKRNAHFMLTVFAAATFAVSAANAESSRKTVTPAEAGRTFGKLCQNVYPDVASTQKKAQRKGFSYVEATGLFEHKSKDMQMRINNEKCALRFLTATSRTKILAEFSKNASPARSNIAGHGDVNLGTEDAGNGQTRVAATRKNSK